MLQLDDVPVQFGSAIALHPTSLLFGPGQFTVLMGRNPDPDSRHGYIGDAFSLVLRRKFK